ncbi:hypothetical protein IGI04_011961 [Brassica rapa subsp. trilocularis]|uniref:Transposase-associated domain-containing protein n=1 Tax=Brassica rapa subsp. trilocularis TaxID=1813537 RepID=A0ABQ7N4K9_BRACM|nr:hypothetical protein IGI04_011961 [Brassica rapa subsp. trilocularis]
MDKSWINKSRLSRDYTNGVKKFLDFAFGKIKVDMLKCPCNHCSLSKSKLRQDIEGDLMCFGFLSSYTEWVLHGEDVDTTGKATEILHAPDDSNSTANLLDDLFPRIDMNTDVGSSSSDQPIVERSNITASLDDEYSKVFGPERSGRVRCLGRGPTPSKLLKMSNTPNLAASNSEVVELKSQVSGLQSQVQNLAGMIQQLVGATTIQTNGAVPNLAGVLSNLANQPNFADILSNLVNQQNSEATQNRDHLD